MDNYQVARRARIGVVIPSTNTGVEYDLQKFALDGVSWHPSRFWIELRDWSDEAEKTGEDIDNIFEQFLGLLRDELPLAIRDVLSAKITHLMLGMSAETFWGGEQGSIDFEKRIRDQIGDIGLTSGSRACREALECFRAKKISVICPYPPVGEKHVRQYFTEIGYEVKGCKGLCSPSATAIAETTISEVMEAVREVDGDDVDVIVQAGTNLSTVDIFPILEHVLGKPMISINVANVWHALRACGINDRITGKGRLLEEF
ncbi:MAG: Asp/Glu racemase [Gammaproteobacteria bacterium]